MWGHIWDTLGSPPRSNMFDQSVRMSGDSHSQRPGTNSGPRACQHSAGMFSSPGWISWTNMRQAALPPHRYYNVTEESKQVMGRANRCPPKSKQATEALSFSRVKAQSLGD
ncbi:unnamed protein product [Arctogadus glacialis]